MPICDVDTSAEHANEDEGESPMTNEGTSSSAPWLFFKPPGIIASS